MNMPKISTGQAQLFLGVAGLAVAIAALYYTKKQVTATAQAVNPMNDNNVINKTANSLLGFDNKTSSLGTWIYDKLHPKEEQPSLKTKKQDQKTTPQQAQKLVAPFLSKTGGDFRFYELKR